MQFAAIPTIHDLSYLRETLISIRSKGNSFRKLNEIVSCTRRDIRNKERVEPSYRDSQDSNNYVSSWGLTVKILRELMVLKLIERGRVADRPPTNLEEQSRLLSTEFQLTQSGELLTSKMCKKSLDIDDAWINTLCKGHSLYYRFLEMLAITKVIYLPEISVSGERTSENISSLKFMDRAVGTIIRILAASRCSSVETTSQELLSYLKEYAGEYYNRNTIMNKTDRVALVKRINSGTKIFLLSKQGLRVGAPAFEVMINWSRDLSILNYSRNLENMPGLTVYLTVDINLGDVVSATRRTVEKVASDVIAGIPYFFNKLKTPGSPWASIYPIRAEICFKNRINDSVFDDIIREIFFQKRTVPYKISLESDLWARQPPSTRPLLLNEDQKRNIISIYDIKR